ncbi:MAG: hypothetical protein LBR73_05620 [Oscillospiraceae bacterium]|jgi:hypothetical protein|nr:hypothetical protein [Oscillospiraceae bacterium]
MKTYAAVKDMRVYFISEAEFPCLPEEDSQQWQQRAAADLIERYVPGIDKGFHNGPYGKPYLNDGPFFNVAHTHGAVLLAVSEYGEVGCDIEKLDRPCPGAERFMQKSERGMNPIQAWVRKEAVAKAAGKGIFRLKPEMIDVSDSQTFCDGRNWQLWDVDIPGYAASIASVLFDDVDYSDGKWPEKYDDRDDVEDFGGLPYGRDKDYCSACGPCGDLDDQLTDF